MAAAEIRVAPRLCYEAPAMVTAGDVLEVLDRVDAHAVTVWLDGGWGIDALLGRETRAHDDLDLVVASDDLPSARAALAPLGFEHALDVEPGLPARLVLRDPRDRRIDFHVIVFDEHGNGWQQLGDDAWGLYPAEGLRGEGLVRGRTVRCITPELQLRHHLGYSWEDDDRRDMRALAERFGLALPPDGT